MTTWRLRVEDAVRGPQDVVVDATTSTSCAALKDELVAHGFSAEEASVRGFALLDGRSLAEIDLAHGDEISCGVKTPAPLERRAGTYLTVVAGVDAGRFLRVADHRQLIGRAAEADLVLADPLVGRQHVHVLLSEGGHGAVRVIDLGSGNGTLVEGAPVTGEAELQPGEVFQCGATVLLVEHIAEQDLPALPEVDEATLPFARRYREAWSPLPTKLQSPSKAVEDELSSSAAWWRPLLPLLSAVALAALTGRWEFLLVMALGPVVLFFEARRNKRAQEAKKQTRSDKAAAEVEAFRRTLDTTATAERVRRRHLRRGPGQACAAASLRSRHVWAKTSDDDDFGALTVGWATMPSDVRVEGGQEKVPDHWRSPVLVPMLESGSLAVLGAPRRSQAVARGLLLSLAIDHSPTDLRVWVLSDEQRSEGWSFARWLPHCFIDGGGARLAASADERASLMRLLLQILETRKEATRANDSILLPLHIVVVDWRGAAADDEVATLIAEGARLGILAIAVETESVLEGVQGTVRLSEHADEAVFESRRHPRVDGVAVAEVATDVADAVARSLSGLRPASSEAASEVDELRLLDLLGTQDMAAGAVLERWRSSPRPSVGVGRSAGTTMTIDVTRHGPHGLVGGTTRSGKTEFLKTLFAGLMLNNTPADLAILIVDFKGGVDHAPFADVPHVISLTTNADVDRFARTIALLVAEQNRRQGLFRDVGAANLDAYNTVRRTNPSLTPIPRLLVVVDEFGELLSTDVGREHLKTLESITRIGGGLGLHLLLVTQTFTSQLPAQVEANTGLRVCFRVQTTADSKVVLDSAAAASIPPSRPGRAYARFQRGDLQEFQCARVAGRRPGLVGEVRALRLVPAPLGTLCSFSVAADREEVPVEESDLGAIIAAVRSAANAIGTPRAPIPWPDELPERVPAATLLRGRRPDDWVLGLADIPERQTQEPVLFEPFEDHCLFLGGPRSQPGDALVSCLAAAALATPPQRLQLYGVDLADGVLSPLVSLPHTGAVAVRNDSLAVKIVRHISDVIAERRALFALHGVTSVAELQLRGVVLPTVVLAVHGAERLVPKEENAPTPLSMAMLRLLSEAAGTGVRIWMTGTTTLGYSRLGTSIARRLVLGVPELHEYPNLGVPRDAAAELGPPGRAFDVTHGRLVQLLTLSGEPTTTTGDVLRALGELWPAEGSKAGTAKRIVDVGWPLSVERLDLGAIARPRDMNVAIPVGVSTSNGELAWFDVEEDGPLFAVVGRAKSGRSTALLSMALLARSAGWSTIGLAPSRRSLIWKESAPFDAVGRVSANGPVDLALPRRPTLVLIDDAHRLDVDDLGLKVVLEHPWPVAIVVAAATEYVTRRQGFLKSLPTARAGLLLAPQSVAEVAFGLQRAPDSLIADPRPGRGLAVANGDAEEVQVAADAGWWV